MKKLLTLLTLFAFVISFTGCDKDDEAPSKVFTATVDGDDFVADEIEGFIDDDIIEVYAEDKEGNTFVAYFNADDFEEGETYDFEDDFDDLEGGLYYANDDDETFFPMSGKLKITKLTESRLEATFEFTSEDEDGEEIEIEDGVIKVTLEKD